MFHGSGELLVHICCCAAVDGQGHSSEHLDIFESWRSISREPEYSGAESADSHNSIADSATSPGTDTEERWARLILDYEAEVSRLNLKTSGVRVQNGSIASRCCAAAWMVLFSFHWQRRPT